MIRLKPERGGAEPKARSRRPPRWGWRLCWLLPLLVLGVLLAERWRGQYALAAWLRDMEARGEVFDIERLWPPSSSADANFSNRLSQAIGRLPKGWEDYGGRLSGMVTAAPGKARRGSQESRLPMHGGAKATHTWQDLEALVREGEPALDVLRELMKDPAASLGPAVHKQILEVDEPFPNFVNVRTAAQALHTAALTRLHQGDLQGALEDLEALSGCGSVYADEPFLVSYMIRIAILGLSDDVYWDALQAPGWSEPQLARLQRASECDELLLQLPKALEAERAGRLHGMRWFASHSYEDWLERYQEVYQEVFQAFGWEPPTCDTGPAVRRWRQWVFHPLWRFAWADQEALHYLQTAQGELEILRESSRAQNWTELSQRLAGHRDGYRPPAAGWRYYIQLPLVDQFSDPGGSSATSVETYPYPDWSRAWFTTLRNLTWHEMVKTVIAAKRFHLRYGSWPLNLHALTPEFLPALPRDLMNGDALCYLLNWDGGFTVYSVGQDGRDDAGDPATWSFRQPARDWSPWDGRDWMWPRGVAPKDAGGQANQSTDQPEHHAGQAPRSQLQKSFSAMHARR